MPCELKKCGVEGSEWAFHLPPHHGSTLSCRPMKDREKRGKKEIEERKGKKDGGKEGSMGGGREEREGEGKKA